MESDEEQEPALSESLVGLVGAFDRLKETMGLDGDGESESMLQIDSYVSGIRDENEELRRHAEDAITMAQKYKKAYEELTEENSGLYEQLTQAKVGDMVSQAQELTAVAYEYDREVVLTKVAQAEEMVAHAYSIQERLDELEEENEALKQTLHELREDQKQMHALRVMDAARLSGGFVEDTHANGKDDRTQCGSPVVGSPRHSTTMAQTPGGPGVGEGEANKADDESASSGTTSQYATPGSGVYSIHTTPKNEDPLSLAEALASVARGSESGMAASASKMLRGYHGMQTELDEARARNLALEKENQELTEMMTSKQFKPPSAWAEREVKHKLEQKEWEEQVRNRDATIKELEAENASLRTARGTVELEERIVDLEAQLVASRRECVDAKTSLHEMQVSSMVGAGEFSTAGVQPLGNQEDVHSIVDKIEGESESSAVSGTVVGHGSRKSDPRQRQLEEELANLKLEKAGILDGLGAIQADIAMTRVAAAKAEIALLENGVSVDTADQILQFEREQDAGHGEKGAVTSSLDVTGPAAGVADALRAARRVMSMKGDDKSMHLIDRLRVTSYIEGYGEDGAAGDDALSAPAMPLEQEAVKRIELLKTEIAELSDIADDPLAADNSEASKVAGAGLARVPGQGWGAAPETQRSQQGMQPRAAAALAAVNRSQAQDLDRLKRQLDDASKRELELQQQLSSGANAPSVAPPPIKPDLNVGGAVSTTSSAFTPMHSPGDLAMARKDADQAWEDHQKKSDVSAILREKAQIEARFDMTKSQLVKSQQALDLARQDASAMRKAIKAAIATGDVKAVQKALEEQAKSSPLKKSSSPLKRLKGRGIFSLKKSGLGSGSNSSSSRPSSGETDEVPNLRLKVGPDPVGREKLDDESQGDIIASREIENLAEENEALMDQLVTAKVRLAEVEGDCLQSRRALVRAREKEMVLTQQLKGLRAGPLERG